jgi:hypothetical protein
MDPLIAFLALLLVASAVVGSGWLACRGVGDILSGLFRGPELGWPHGVQEDEPVPWNWTTSSPERVAELLESGPRASPLRPQLGRGLARKGRW